MICDLTSSTIVGLCKQMNMCKKYHDTQVEFPNVVISLKNLRKHGQLPFICRTNPFKLINFYVAYFGWKAMKENREKAILEDEY